MLKENVRNKIYAGLPCKIDYLLICASFEDRCLSLSDYLDEKNVSKTGIFYFKQFLNESECNLVQLEKKFRAKRFGLDYSSPTSTADSLIHFFESAINCDQMNLPNVVIDISTFTRESLLILLRFLYLKSDRFKDIYLFYRFAEVSGYLSNGVASIRTILGYPGDISFEKPTHLILFSGFEHERAKEIIDTVEPDHLSIGIGGSKSAITPQLYKQNKEFTDRLLAYYPAQSITVFEHSVKDPILVKNSVLEIVKEKSDYNSVIASLNNKISTIGVALAANENRTIQLIYAQVSDYNVVNYSKCIDDCLIFNLKELWVLGS